jgi:hypothetical protein
MQVIQPIYPHSCWSPILNIEDDLGHQAAAV